MWLFNNALCSIRTASECFTDANEISLMMLWQGGDVLLAFPWAQCVCGVGFPAAWGAHPRAFQQETPPSDGTFYSPWSSPPLPLQIVSDSWCQGWVREEVVASVLPCHPPARHRLSPGSEQSSTTQGLLAGTENSDVPFESLSVSATFQDLMSACSG